MIARAHPMLPSIMSSRVLPASGLGNPVVFYLEGRTAGALDHSLCIDDL